MVNRTYSRVYPVGMCRGTLQRVALGALFTLTGCAGSVSIEGSVVDEQGRPIQAQVLLGRSDPLDRRSAATDSNGEFYIGMTVPPGSETEMTITATGFEPYVEVFGPQTELKNARFVLLPEKASAPAIESAPVSVEH